MPIKKQLCNIIIHIKDSESLTYNKLQEKTGVLRSQLVQIIVHEGKDVSLSVIEHVIKMLGYSTEVHLVQKLCECCGD